LQTIDKILDAVRAFAAGYNAEWLIEKTGYRSLLGALALWFDTSIRRSS